MASLSVSSWAISSSADGGASAQHSHPQPQGSRASVRTVIVLHPQEQLAMAITSFSTSVEVGADSKVKCGGVDPNEPAPALSCPA